MASIKIEGKNYKTIVLMIVENDKKKWKRVQMSQPCDLYI